MTARLAVARAVAVLAGAAALALAGCATGALSDSPSTSASPVTDATTTLPTRAVLTVTVPDLPDSSAAAALASPSPAQTAPSGTDEPAAATPPAPPADGPAASATEPGDDEPAEPAAQDPDAVPGEPAPAPAPPPGDPVTVTLANCNGCTVIGSRGNVAGELSATLVATSAGRAVLLSLLPDGEVRGVINVPYGSSFPAPAGGVLACDPLAHCAIDARQPDGRAIVSTFELTGPGAWRDISGDDAFPSATDRSAIVDLGGELGIAVQEGADGVVVWMLYRWSGEKYTVVGCAADGPPPASADAVTPDACLS